jgi:hypothetical protein
VEIWQWAVWQGIDLKAMHQKSYQGLKAQVKINTGGHRTLRKISRKEKSKY